MKILILGAGQVGSTAAVSLAREEANEVTIVDRNPDVLRERILTELFPDAGSRLRLLALRLAGRADPLFEARDRLAEEAQRLGRLAITEVMLTLDLPHGRTLRLGQVIRGAYPRPLQTIGHPELLDLLAQFSSAAGTQARADWSRLPDRMRFIAQLFRIYQEDISLFDPPYTAKEWAELRDQSTRTL